MTIAEQLHASATHQRGHDPNCPICNSRFTDIQKAVGKQFKEMSAKRLFSTGTDSAALWDTYLASFPEGFNPIYKKRTEHDCGNCRHFIKALGGVVNILDGKIITLWDFKIDGPYQVVADAMAAYVRERAIENVYLNYQRMVGQGSSRQLLEDKTVKTWDHYYVNLPASAVVGKDQIGPRTGEFRATHDVMLRGLTEITTDAVETALDLIAQGSLYRGEEHKFAVLEFQKLQAKFHGLSVAVRDLFVWERMESVHASVARIRNSVIGTLLTDLSEGKELEDAVKAFEVKVAPTNYKRPTALVTKAMVAQAQKKVDELGLTTALERRYATIDDITVSNILFADRAIKSLRGNVFDDIAAGAAVDIKKLGKVEEVPIADFISKVLPTAKTVEALFENRHAGNMVSLIAPVDATAKPLFKWPNGFSWSYVGDLADSIKERVKQAGGSVTGDFRASLAWYNYDDLDLHLKGPGLYIWFRSKTDFRSGGALDVDMNAGSGKTRSAVENITFPKREKMPEGEYTLFVNQFHPRESKDVGFEVEMEFDGQVYNFAWANAMRHTQNVVVCKFAFTRKDGLKILESLPTTQASKAVWALPTQTFQKVRVVMLSPNQWDGREIGNRHYFFMLEGCKNDGTARGFFNEFLGEALTPHRKVLEMVGARMKTEESDRQLSGLGFSSTRRDHLLCRVTGSFARTVKVGF
jgi:hypothetical protein